MRISVADIDLLWSPHPSGTHKHAPPLRVRVKGSVGSTFCRAGAVLVLDLFALGRARVPVCFAVGAADWFINLSAHAFCRAGSFLEVNLFALGRARVPVRFAVGAADGSVMLWANAKFWFRRLGAT